MLLSLALKCALSVQVSSVKGACLVYPSLSPEFFASYKTEGFKLRSSHLDDRSFMN